MRSERGLALILVLWSLMLLTVIAITFGFAVRVETTAGFTLADQLRAEAVAGSGVRLALLQLLGQEDQRWPMDGAVHEIPWPEATLRASVRAESAKIDLNLAPPELLKGLFTNLLPDSDAEALVEAVMKRRERAGQQSPVAPAATTALASPPRVWRRGPAPSQATATASAAFRSVDELALLPGFDPASVRRLRPYLTVHGGNAKVAAASADVVVLASIPDVTPAAAEAFIRDRAGRSGSAEALDLTLLGAGAAYLDTNPTAPVADIRAAARLADGTAAMAEAVVQLGAGGQSHQILDWRDGWTDFAPAAAGVAER